MRIYFAYDEDEFAIKIGISRDVKYRLKTLRNDYPSIKLLGTMEGDFSKEKEIHQLFKGYQVSNEWFKFCPDILNFIALNSTPLEQEYEFRDYGNVTGNPVRDLIKLNNVPISYIARKSGISQATIAALIAPLNDLPRDTKLSTLDKLAHALGYRVNVTFEKIQ